MNKIYSIYIYLIITFIILAPFLYGYIFILDFVSKINIDHNLELLYGNVVLEYGGCLPLIIFISIEIFRKLLIFIILFCCGCLAYNLANRIMSIRISRFYVGLLYMINPYTYVRIMTGQLFLLFSYAILPLLLIFFIDVLEKQQKKEMIKFIFALSIVAFNIHMLIISLIIMSIIFIFWSYKFKDLITKILLISGILFVLLNNYWLTPLLIAKNTRLDNIIYKDMEVFAPNIENNIYGLFDLAAMYGFWREGYLYAKDFLPGWQFFFLIILSLAIIGFLSYYKDEKIGFMVKAFAVIWIIGFILASGIKGPLSGTMYWLFDNTILKGFRDSHKFVTMMVLAYSILGGLGINKIKNIYDRYN